MWTRGFVILTLLILVLTGMPVPAHAALIGTEQEIQIGRQAAAEVESEFGLIHDPTQNQRVTSLGLRVAARSSRPNLPWTFRILAESEVNAISLPGGFIYVTLGMLNFVRSDHELAFVLAHEVGHVDRRHHVQMLERSFFLSIVTQVLFGRDVSSSQIANFVRVLLSRGFSREFEFEADRVGVELVHKAGFRALAGLAFMERLRAASGRDPSSVEVLFRTHPGLPDRITRVRQQLRALGYNVAGIDRFLRAA